MPYRMMLEVHDEATPLKCDAEMQLLAPACKAISGRHLGGAQGNPKPEHSSLSHLASACCGKSDAHMPLTGCLPIKT